MNFIWIYKKYITISYKMYFVNTYIITFSFYNSINMYILNYYDLNTLYLG